MALRALLILSCVGCYEHHVAASHEVVPDAADRDAASRDGGRVDASMRDAAIADSAPRLFDGAPFPDADAPVSPGERPSDDPTADDWLPSPSPSDEPCCTIGEVVGIDNLEDQGGVPVIAWNGTGWGIAWSAFREFSDHQLGFRSVSELVEPLGSVSFLEGFEGTPRGLAWANGRYALLVAGGSHLAILDRDGLPRAARSLEPFRDGALSRYSIAHAWVVATVDESDDTRLAMYDDALREVGPSYDLGPTPSLDRWSIDMVDMRSRFVVLQAAPDGVWIRTYAGADLDPVHEHLREMNFGAPRGGDPSSTALMGARLRDEVMSTFIERGSLWSMPIDPWTHELDEPVQLAAVSHAYSPGVAGDDKLGVAGICFIDGGTDGNPDEVWFAAVNTSGQLVGAPVRVVEELDFAAACDVARGDAGEFFVVWWAATGPTPRYSVLGARVTLR